MREFYAASIVLYIVVSLLYTVHHVQCKKSENRLSDAIIPKVYDLFIQVDMNSHVFNGRMIIDVHVNSAVSTIQLHNIGLVISDKVVVNNATDNNIISESINILYNNATEIMDIKLDQTLLADSDYKILLSFNGSIEFDMKGLYMSTYYDGEIKYIATTFSAAAYARKIFPCFDEPNFKAKFRLKVACPNGFFTLANTEAINTELVDDWSITEFNETIPMSTYLLAFTVSNFKNLTTLGNPQFSVYASSKEYKNMEFALNISRSALKALEEYTIHSYPLNKMDFIAIDDFLYGAMENWGLISFKTSRIVNPVGKRNRKKIQDIINIISHELVHQWFGNLVTCEYWDYVWLNEGFASYLEYIIADMILPEWRILEQFTIEDMHPVMLNDVKPKTHAMTRNVNTPEEITKIYDFVAYPKAASVIRMMEQLMTPEIFKSMIYRYLFNRKYSTATDEDLYEAIDSFQGHFNIKKQNFPKLSDIFRSWANNEGFPILNVQHTKGEITSTVQVSQELFIPNLNETEISNFIIPYNYITSENIVENNWNPTFNTFWRSLNETEANFKLDKQPNWIIFNIQQTGYYRVNYDTDNWNAIINVLDSSTYSTIHFLNRAQLLDDSFNLAKSGYLDFTINLNILKYLRREYELVPITAGFKAIQFMLSHLNDQPFYEDFKNIMLNIIDEIYERVNYPSHPEYPKTFSENHHAVLKLKVNLFACRFGATSCVKDADEKMNFDDVPDIDDRPYFYCGILRSKSSENQWNNLWTRLEEIVKSTELYRDNQEEISEILYAFSYCDNDPQRVNNLLMKLFNKSQSATDNKISNDDATVIIGNLIRASKIHRELVMDFYDEHYETVKEIVPLTAVLSAFAEAINTEDHSKRLKNLAANHGIDVSKTIEEIEKNIHWMSMKVPEIATWVKNEKGAAIKLNFSIIAVIFSLSIIALK
ncbi:aminopeptidase N-like [Chironomus tepperi]|uniref:aminopeptidase N-like n=1 Tax=Chironomus tepperi TaxID=113505 RepID=UPI00391F5358